MAEFVPSTIIQTPDFLGMAQQRQAQMKKEKAATYNYIKDYKQTGENYLEGFIPAVQSMWNGVESAMRDVAADDNISTRRALDNAYAQYSQVAGKAKFLTEGYHQNTSAYRSDPSAYGITYDEYDQTANMYRYTPQTPATLLGMDEYVVPKAMEFQITAPNEMAKTIYDQISTRLDTDFYDPETATYDMAGILATARQQLVRTVGYGTENMEMATVYGGLRSLGKDKITNSQQYNFIMGQDEDTKIGFAEDYVESVMKILPGLFKRTGDETKGISDSDLGLKTFVSDPMFIYDPDGKMASVIGAKGLTLPRPMDTSYAYPTAEKSVNEIANDKYGQDYDNLSDKEKAAVDKEHSAQTNKPTAIGREVRVKEKIIKFYERDGNYFVETESAIDDDLSKKITAIKAGVGGALLIQEDGKKMTTTRRATDAEVAQVLSNRGIERAMQGSPMNMGDPAGLLNNSVPSSSDPLGLGL